MAIKYVLADARDKHLKEKVKPQIENNKALLKGISKCKCGGGDTIFLFDYIPGQGSAIPDIQSCCDEYKAKIISIISKPRPL